MKNKRILEYDIIRTIATYSVIIVHLSAIALGGYEQGSTLSIFAIFLNRMLKFTTPVFIFLAGALIQAKYKNEKFNYIIFLKSRFKRILIPYFFVSLFYYIIITYLNRDSYSLLTYIKQFVTGNAQYHLYFIPIIIQLYILTPVFLYLKKKTNYYLLIPALSIISFISVLYLKFTYSDRIFIKFIIPYIIGVYFGNYIIEFLKKIGSKVYLLIGSTLIIGIMYSIQFKNYYYNLSNSSEIARDSLWFIYCILSIFALIFLANKLKVFSFVKFTSKRISSASYYIYLLHPFFILISEKLLNKLLISSTSVRFLFNIIFVIFISTLSALIIINLQNKKIQFFYKNLNKKYKIIIISILLFFTFYSSISVYNHLINNGIINSFANIKITHEITKQKKYYKEELLDSNNYEYVNQNFGFKYYYNGFESDLTNELIKTTFSNDNIILDVYYENLEGTVHTSQSYTNYGNEKIVTGEFVTVKNNKFLRYEDKLIHIIEWSRPTLKLVEDDFNYYVSIDIIKNDYEVYNISIRSNEEIDTYDYLSRFDMIEIDTSVELNSVSYQRKTNNRWSDETKDFYQSQFIESKSVNWGIFEPTSVNGLEALRNLEDSINHKFKFLLQYYDLNYPIDMDNLKDIYDGNSILEFTFQTSIYGEFDPNIVLKILDGQYADKLDIVVDKLIALDKPVLFRLNNEMNGDWCLYNSFFYQKDTSLYLELWKYIYNKFDEKNANNIIWLWNPNESSFPDFKWNHYSNYFPGEEYVDIIGVTGYNTGNFYSGETWRTFEEIYDEFMPDYKAKFENFPFMITEFGSSIFGGDKLMWMEDMLSVIEKYEFKVAIYWNSIDYTPDRTKARVYKFDDDMDIVNLLESYFNK